MANIAIKALEKTRQDLIERHEREMAEINAAIAALSNASEERTSAGTDTSTPVKAGQYKGMKAAPALQMYLIARGGGPVPMEQVVRDLRVGGMEPEWSEERYPRNVKIMISNNARMFRYDEDSDTVELIARGRK